MDHLGSAEVRILIPVDEPEHVSSGAVEAQQHAGVLDAPVRVQQLRAHRADAGTKGVRDHLAQPVRGDHLDVVVEQADDLATRFPHREVVDGRIVERGVVAQDTRRAVSGQFLEIRKRARIAALVVDYDHLVRGVTGLLEHAADGALEDPPTIAGRNDERDQRRRRQRRVADVVRSRHLAGRYDRGWPVEVAQRAQAGLARIAAAGGCAPVIENVRNVADSPGARRSPKAEVVVFAPIESAPQAPQRPQERCAVGDQVPDVHPRGKQLRIPVGLEEGPKDRSPRIDLVLVAVDEIGAGMRSELLREEIEGMRGELVPGFEEGDQLARGQCEGVVGGDRKLSAFAQL